MSKKIILLVAGFLVCFNIAAWQLVFDLNSPQLLEVNFFSVGQGDSEFIKTPDNRYILIDGGPSSAVLQKLAGKMPFWNKTIDIVVLTHPEKDHMTGILDILQRYNVKYFLWTGVVKNDAENIKLANLLQEASSSTSFLASLSGKEPTKIINSVPGQKIHIGSVTLDILYPFENLVGKELKNSGNDASIVVKIIYGNDSFLFTGDISSVAEKQLVNSYKTNSLQADVLKVAHHGSKYSTSDLFLEKVEPIFAVIEVGKNSYGHPTPEVLQRLEKFGINVFITQQDGDIEFISDGKIIKKL